MDYETIHETLIEIVQQGRLKEEAEELLRDELGSNNAFSVSEKEEIIKLASKLNSEEDHEKTVRELVKLLMNSTEFVEVFKKRKES